VNLEGDFPAGFKQLSRCHKKMLDEFRAVSDQIEMLFINPSSSKMSRSEIRSTGIVRKGFGAYHLAGKGERTGLLSASYSGSTCNI
jgi:hypothetical protein